MPLMNRVTPAGEIVADPARGTLMGNRGGRLHDPVAKTLMRPWASRRWIACELHFRGRHHEPMGSGYTSLFFLDEVTALAAGHRPCFECRREAARQFLALSGLANADELDRAAHEARLVGRAKRTFRAPLKNLPDGTVIRRGETMSAVRNGRLLRWSPSGYLGDAAGGAEDVEVLTPAVFVDVLSRGYRPRWHPTAEP
ncbi:MAG TPA: hypothetical protein VJS40_01255 [Aestuariivirgaceae bacterium]|nr:hypothetical protein [Aestuariivirgaceae bacterium]